MNAADYSEFLLLKSVRIRDAFWTPFMKQVRTKVIPISGKR